VGDRREEKYIREEEGQRLKEEKVNRSKRGRRSEVERGVGFPGLDFRDKLPGALLAHAM